MYSVKYTNINQIFYDENSERLLLANMPYFQEKSVIAVQFVYDIRAAHVKITT